MATLAELQAQRDALVAQRGQFGGLTQVRHGDKWTTYSQLEAEKALAALDLAIAEASVAAGTGRSIRFKRFLPSVDL